MVGREKDDSSQGSRIEAVFARMLATVRSRAQYRLRLVDKGFSDEQADLILDKYEELGLVDDREYARLFVLSHEDWGVLRVKDALRGMGVENHVIGEVLDELDVDDEINAARLVGEYVSFGLDGEKIMGKLLRKGFRYGLVAGLLSNLPFSDDDE